MKIKKEQEEMVVNFGAFDYDAEKIASILEIDKQIIEAELKKKDSDLNRLMQKGRYLAEYVIDLKLFEMAKTGDVKALDKFEERKIFRGRR